MIFLAFPLGAYADEIAEQLQTCIDTRLAGVLSGKIKATDVINSERLIQRVIGKNWKYDVTKAEFALIQKKAEKLLDESFQENKTLFLGGIIKVTSYSQKRDNYFIKGQITTAQQKEYTYSTRAYFMSTGGQCKFYAITIAKIFTLKKWVLHHKKMESVFDDTGVDR